MHVFVLHSLNPPKVLVEKLSKRTDFRLIALKPTFLNLSFLPKSKSAFDKDLPYELILARRVNTGLHGYIPILVLRVDSSDKGSQITAQVKHRPFVIMNLSIAVLAYVLLLVLDFKNITDVGLLILLVMIIFIYLHIYSRESNRLKKMLEYYVK